MEPRSMVVIADTLRKTREHLSSLAKQYFSDHANKNRLWKDQEEKSLNPVKMHDSGAIAFTKHCLLALQESEALVHSIDKLVEEYEAQGARASIFAVKKAAGALAEGMVNRDNPAAEEEPWALDLALKVKDHLQAIYEMAQSNNSTDTTGLKKIIDSLSGVQAALLDPKQAKEKLAANFSNVSGALSDLMSSYLDSTRPMMPTEPERKYETTKPIKFDLLSEVPKKFDTFEADSYLIIQDKTKKWQVLYLDAHKNSYPIERLDIDLWMLQPALANKSPAELKANKEDRVAIKNALAKHWNPNAQERAEWFVLLEPLRSTMQGTQKLSALFENFAKDAKRKDIQLPPEQTEMIKRTQAVLERSSPDKEGYYTFLDEKDETPLSQSLKAIYNVMWGINELGRGYWEHPGLRAHLGAKNHGLRVLDSYWKILWPQLGGELGMYSDQLINAMLIYGKETTFPLLAELTARVDDAAIQHDLRPGMLLQQVRPILDALESSYIERGFAATNPLGYNPERAAELQQKLAAAKQEEPVIARKMQLTANVSSQLEWFEPYANLAIAQPGSAARIFADAIGKVSIVDLAESKAILLLHEVVKLKSEISIDKKTLKLIDKLENQLIAMLPLEKKIALLKEFPAARDNVNARDLHIKIQAGIAHDEKIKIEWSKKSYLARGRELFIGAKATSPADQITAAEIMQLRKTMEEINYGLSEKSHLVSKYTEAAAAHEKLRTEYAERVLTNEGLNGLIRATLAAKDDPLMNLAHKRKLAVIIADFTGIDRAINLKKAHEIATAFVSNPSQIKSLVEAIHKQLPALGHQLAIETMIAGDADYAESFIFSDNQDAARQGLANLLDRFEAKQVIDTLRLVGNGDEEASARMGVITSLLLGGEALAEENINKSLAEVMQNKLSKKDFVGLIELGYDQQPADIKNKLGRFLGRLTRVDAEFAGIVFHSKKALTILQDECLTKVNDGKSKADPVLYYESLVNTFYFGYVKGRHEEENRSTAAFASAHRSIIIEMHKAVHEADKNKSEASIIAAYESPSVLVDLTEQFIKGHLLKGSPAESRMREFFSALMLTDSDEMNQMRKVIVDNQLESKGSLQAQYIELLTTVASGKFWNKIKSDLVSRPQEQLFHNFDTQEEIVKNILAGLDPSVSKDMMAEVKQVFTAQKEKINAIVAKLTVASPDIALQCKFAQQEMNKIEHEVEKKMQGWQSRAGDIYFLEQKKDAFFKFLWKEVAAIRAETEFSLEDSHLELLKFIDQQKVVAEVAVANFKKTGGDVGAIEKNMVDLKDAVAKKVNHWMKVKVNLMDSAMFVRQINQIEKTLTEYLDNRKGVMADVAEAFGYSLRNDKIKLVTAKLEEIKAVKQHLQSDPDADVKAEGEKVVGIINELDREHNKLLEKEERSAAKTMVNAAEKPVYKKAGTLNTTISQIQTMLSKAQGASPVQKKPIKQQVVDDLKERISWLAQVKSIIIRYIAKLEREPTKQKKKTVSERHRKKARR